MKQPQRTAKLINAPSIVPITHAKQAQILQSFCKHAGIRYRLEERRHALHHDTDISGQRHFVAVIG